MLDTVIKVEGLSKSYLIRHADRERYMSFRDALTKKSKQIVKGIARPFASLQKSEGPQKREEFRALNNVSFEVKQGERIGIIGRNGAGKSTLLKLLSRITAPTKGSIDIYGRVGSLLEVGTGFHPELTGRENIFLNGAILGMRNAEIRKKFDEIVAFAEVEKFLDTPVKHYSSGMYVRLAFAVAAHLEPEILVVDEVLAVGDAQFQKKCLGKMEDISTKFNRTICFVSHHMPSIQRLCDRTILIKEGKIDYDGKTNDVTERYLQEDTGFALHWYARPASHYDAFLKEVSVCDPDGREMEYLTTSSTFKIVLTFSIVHKINNLRVSIDILNKNGELLFASEPLDSGIDLPGKPGFYSASMIMPDDILLARGYGIRAVLWTSDAGILDVMENLWFSVQETDSFCNRVPNGRAGCIGIKCNWSIAEVT